MAKFKLNSAFEPAGDQLQAIGRLVKGLQAGQIASTEGLAARQIGSTEGLAARQIGSTEGLAERGLLAEAERQTAGDHR